METLPRRALALLLVIAAGLLSRALHTGSLLIDKYLGDALYAVMVYLLLPAAKPLKRAALAMVILTALECFQLTGIPAAMVHSQSLPTRLTGRLLGTTFAWADLAAYAAGTLAAAAFSVRRVSCIFVII